MGTYGSALKMSSHSPHQHTRGPSMFCSAARAVMYYSHDVLAMIFGVGSPLTHGTHPETCKRGPKTYCKTNNSPFTSIAATWHAPVRVYVPIASLFALGEAWYKGTPTCVPSVALSCATARCASLQSVSFLFKSV